MPSGPPWETTYFFYLRDFFYYLGPLAGALPIRDRVAEAAELLSFGISFFQLD